MLGDDPWTTYATGDCSHAYLDAYAGRLDVVREEDAPDILLESWRYKTDAQGDCVDDISLYLSLKGNNEDDPRLDDALEALREMICS